MCFLCELFGGDLDYVEVSSGALKDSAFSVFGMLAKVPPAMVPIWPSGRREPALFYN